MARGYVFRTFDDVYDEATLARLRVLHDRVVPGVSLDATTTQDLSIVEREGRLDVLLAEELVQVSESVLEFVSTTMAAGVRLQPCVRTFLVDGARPAQPWHRDYVALVESARPVFATLLVALEDITDAMGGTEFRARHVPESGVLAPEDLDESAVLRVLLKRNQGLLFDGRILHRGAASSCTRAPIMYHLFERSFQ